ncbi:hypothetical protein AZF37_00260 [endosymbiont 'TC1' of Trimyema compressum]|uniref:MptD family putative ECF transporter S component n=1 Tax=endosymbiont 'TC1' of Trimyema compressum TaxID=243899 RepID=UPI0007F07C60|nr:MptD family putative ECF transporter S component [endosymbiont 'TC1' of Trimyema compressum]AMP19815.1 hypothetical protein AZF37_00260 [endosymbiont 'TC1' of Trimyema compressum]
MFFLWLGFVLPMVIMKDCYIEYAALRGISADYISSIVTMMNSPVALAGLIGFVVGAHIGSILGKRLLKNILKKQLI